MTSAPTTTAQHRGACRHDQSTRSATPMPTRPAIAARPTSPARPADPAGTCEPWPVLELSDLLVGVDDVPCQENDAELWFADSPQDVEFAKSLCGTCPVRAACLDGALSRREPWGVWGGELFMQGQVVPRKRPRGRPRKDEVA